MVQFMVTRQPLVDTSKSVRQQVIHSGVLSPDIVPYEWNYDSEQCQI